MKMKFGPLLPAVVACISATALPAHADDKQDIQALYTRLAKAVMNKDIKGVISTGTSDMTYTEAGRTITAQQASAQMSAQFNALKVAPKVKMTVSSCTVKGKEAKVVSNHYTEVTTPAGPDGKTHVVTVTSKSNDTLVKTPKGWLIKNANIESNKYTMDGKPFDPMNPAGAPKK
jgi:ketosteroid isomerase-like protein